MFMPVRLVQEAKTPTPMLVTLLVAEKVTLVRLVQQLKVASPITLFDMVTLVRPVQ